MHHHSIDSSIRAECSNILKLLGAELRRPILGAERCSSSAPTHYKILSRSIIKRSLTGLAITVHCPSIPTILPMNPTRSVLITGCSDSGVGAGLALVFQARGYHVFATTRNPEKMSTLEHLPNITLLQLDVVEPSQIRAAVEAVTAITGGTLSVLINNAARFQLMPLLDDDMEAAKQTFETNVWGPLAVTKAFAPLLIQARGMLVNITTIAGHNPMPYSGKFVGLGHKSTGGKLMGVEFRGL